MSYDGFQLFRSPVMRLLLRRAALIGLLVVVSAFDVRAAGVIERESMPSAEKVVPVECSAKNCLIVEKQAIYCSIDPHQVKEGHVFSTKSELHLPAGVYPLSQAAALSDFPVRIRTPFGERIFLPSSRDIFSFYREERDPEIQMEPLEWLEVKAGYATTDMAVDLFFLRTSRWPHGQYRLGDPQDVRWFFAAARNLFIQVTGGEPLFPELAEETIFYAPCAMRDLPDQYFRFAFEDGSALDLRVRTINGVNQIGFYMGRLMEAQGKLAGADLRLDDRNDLALFGSTRSWGEMTIPSFAIRTARNGAVCGLLLDSSQWDTDKAVNGYIAYELTCNGHRGNSLPLLTVTYPSIFSFP